LVVLMRDVTCPLCGGGAKETFHYIKGYARYRCAECGYVSDTRAAENPRKLAELVPRNLRGYVRWAQFDVNSGAVFVGQVPWWPEELVDPAKYQITPVVVKGGLRWRRRDAEILQRSMSLTLTRWSKFYFDYKSFGTATCTSKEVHEVLIETLRTNPHLRIKLLHDVKEDKL